LIMRPNNDNNVYVLGAGFSAEAGLPVITSFLGRMRDAFDWLQGRGREDELRAIERVLQFRHESAAAGYRINLDLDNIEHLFSLAAAKAGTASAADIRSAISSTLDFGTETGRPPIRRMRISEPRGWPCTPQWRDEASRWIDASAEFTDVESSIYDYYAAFLSGLTANKTGLSRNTVVSLNYDLLLEKSLRHLAIPFSYGLAGPGVAFDADADGDASGEGAFELLKLHGSINWGEAEDGSVRVHRDYESVRAAKLSPLLVPPTWHKSAGDPLLRVWEAAVAALAAATRITLIGFSIPAIDQHFKYLLAVGLKENSSLRSVKIVDPRCDELLQQYQAVFREDQFRYGVVQVRSSRAAEYLFDEEELASLGRSLAHPAAELVADDRSSHHIIMRVGS
jgi:hypothetical protein